MLRNVLTLLHLVVYHVGVWKHFCACDHAERDAPEKVACVPLASVVDRFICLYVGFFFMI